jgi:hypothetical protein
MSSLPSAPFGNRPLQALPADERVQGSLPIKTVLFEPDEIIDSVYFPLGPGIVGRERWPVHVTNCEQ